MPGISVGAEVGTGVGNVTVAEILLLHNALPLRRVTRQMKVYLPELLRVVLTVRRLTLRVVLPIMR